MTDLFDDADDTTEVVRDGKYWLPDIDDPKGPAKPRQRCTNFAATISDSYALGAYQERQVALGLARRPDLVGLAAATRPNDKDALDEIAQRAKAAADSDVGANTGKALHSIIERRHMGENPFIPPQWRDDVAAHDELVEQAGLEFDADHIERVILQPTYNVGGRFDSMPRTTKSLTFRHPDWSAPRASKTITIPAGFRVMFDLKTGKDPSYDWPKIRIQLAMYADGYMWDEASREYILVADDDFYPDWGLVLHLPAGRGKAYLYPVDLNRGRVAARLCRETVAMRSRRKVEPISIDDRTEFGPTPVPPAEPVGAVVINEHTSSDEGSMSYEQLIEMAHTVSDLTAVRESAERNNVWTPSLRALAMRRYREIAGQVVV